MQGIDRILPFLEKSPIVNIRQGKIKVKDLFITEGARQYADLALQAIASAPENLEKYHNQFGDTVFNVTYVKPLNMAILMGVDDLTLGFILALYDTIDANITTVHYSKVALEMNINNDDIPSMKYALGYDVSPFAIVDMQYISNAMNFKPIFAELTVTAGDDEGNILKPFDSTITDFHSFGPLPIQEGYVETLFGFDADLDEALHNGSINFADINEAILNIGKLGKANPKTVGKTTQNSRKMRALDLTLETYLLSTATDARVPMLTGASGVAKSARVKAVCEKHGFRLVDVRLAFMERADVLGYTTTDQYVNFEDDENVKTRVSESCPACGLITCTDAYIDYCDKAYNIIQKKLATTTDKDTIKCLETALAKFAEGRKTPVLFLDEITRAPDSIRGPFTKILSDKRFNGMPMTKAKILAATNIMIGNDGKEIDDYMLKSIFQTVNSKNAAFADRFTTIPITPESVQDDWCDWGASRNKNGGSNIHPVILDFLRDTKQMGTDYYYDINPMIEANNIYGEKSEVCVTPYPNYRTWEMVSNHIYRLTKALTRDEQDKQYASAPENQKLANVCYDRDTVVGLLGAVATDAFVQYAEMKGIKTYQEMYPPTQEDEDDPLMYRMKVAYATNTPMLMATPSAMGKSSRIMELQQQTGAMIQEINLAEQTRSDLLGAADIVDITEFALDGVVNLPTDVVGELNTLVNDLADKDILPRRVTKKFPKGSLYKAVKEAAIAGKDLIIHFDEMNRVSDPSIMSAVFEAVSDHRLMGVDFDPSKIRVFASCNVGANHSDGTSNLDPAFAARFTIFRKRAYDMNDVKAFIAYMHKKNFHPAIIGWFEQLDEDAQLECLQSVERRDMAMSAPSSRGIKDLSNNLSQVSTNKALTGVMIFNPSSVQANMNALSKDVINYNSNSFTTTFKALAKEVKKHGKNWCGLGSPITLNMGDGNEASPEDVIDTILEIISQIENDISVNGHCSDGEMANAFYVLLEYMLGVEHNVEDARKFYFEAYLGKEKTDPYEQSVDTEGGSGYRDFSALFIPYYNEVSGRIARVYTIEECTTIDIWQEFIAQELNKISNEDDRGDEIAKLMVQWYNQFKGQALVVSLAQDVILNAINAIRVAEIKSNIAISLATNPVGEQLLIAAEQKDGVDFALKLLTVCSMRASCTPEMIDRAKNNVELPKM